MRLPVCHPNFVYCPHSEETKRRMSISQRRRLGIPDGHVQIYGHHIPERCATPLRYWATWIAWKLGRDEAERFVAEQKAAEYPDLARLTAMHETKIGASAVRRMIRAVWETTYAN